MSVYLQSIEDGKILSSAEEVRKETDCIRMRMRRELIPIANDIKQEIIIPEIEKAVNNGQYSCDIDLPKFLACPNKYGKELHRQDMSFVHDLITEYLSDLGYKVLILDNAFDACTTLAIRVIWCAIEEYEKYNS